MNIRFNLLKKIKENGLHQKDFAELVGDDPSVVSRVINGVWNPGPLRKARYAKVLRCKPDEIFED